MPITLESTAAELTATRGYPRNKIADACSVLVMDVRVGAALSHEQADEVHLAIQDFDGELRKWDAYSVNEPDLACYALERLANLFDSYGGADCPNEPARIRAAKAFLAACATTL